MSLLISDIYKYLRLIFSWYMWPLLPLFIQNGAGQKVGPPSSCNCWCSPISTLLHSDRLGKSSQFSSKYSIRVIKRNSSIHKNWVSGPQGLSEAMVLLRFLPKDCLLKSLMKSAKGADEALLMCQRNHYLWAQIWLFFS